MRTIFVKPTIPTPAELLDPVLRSPMGRNVFSYRALEKRPRQRFTLRFAANDQETQESLRELTYFNGGYQPVWFDGNAWAETTTPILVWVGDGATKEFILPFTNVFPASSVFYENRVIKSDWTMPDNGVSGITTFTTPPLDGAEITWKGVRKLKVIVVMGRDRVYRSAERAPRVFEESIELEEVP